MPFSTLEECKEESSAIRQNAEIKIRECNKFDAHMKDLSNKEESLGALREVLKDLVKEKEDAENKLNEYVDGTPSEKRKKGDFNQAGQLAYAFSDAKKRVKNAENHIRDVEDSIKEDKTYYIKYANEAWNTKHSTN